jgi:sodium-dependent dicarboxylate transporter 2/3/5
MQAYKKKGFWIGIVIFLVIALSPPPSALSFEAWVVAGISLLMAVWWATEAVPLPVTALLPLALFPLFGVFSDNAKIAFQLAASPYAHPNIYLFLGGFILALAIEKVNLHKRMALNMLVLVGNNGKYLIGGFMLSSCLLSMWIMNTSTTLMLLPIGLAVATVIQDTVKEITQNEFLKFQTSLLLGIAYAASIGGMATPVGTGPNLLTQSILSEQGVEIDFFTWMSFAAPLSIAMLVLGWYVLTHLIFPVKLQGSQATKYTLKEMLHDLGPISTNERKVFYVFILTALAWMLRKYIVLIPGLEGITDYGIAIIAAISLFIIPSYSSDSLIKWDITKNLPWGILILFGGGLSMAKAIEVTELGHWIGSYFEFFQGNSLLLIIVVVTLIIFLTELTSNQATTATFVPIMIGIAAVVGFDKAQLAVPVALASSCAFMLPVATPPNAIVYASEKLTIQDMMKAGFYLNLLGILLVTCIAYFLLPILLST